MLTFSGVWRATDVRRSILFVFTMLFVFRVAAHIPVPGVDASALADVFSNNQFFGLLNVFSGGTLESFSIVAMGVGPYITASIILQLLAMIVPKLEEFQKEEQGRRKINQWTRYFTVPLSFLQGYGLISLLNQQSQGAFGSLTALQMGMTLLTLTAGTVFLMWLGELMSEKHVGNGVSIIILAGILAGLPTAVSQIASVYDRSQLITVIAFAAVALLTVVAVVVMQEAQRVIPVQYARLVRGSRLAGSTTSQLPLRLNPAGVIPIIFAISLILFPTFLAQFFVGAKTTWVSSAAEWVLAVFQNQWVYGVIYFALVFLFTFFYTFVVFRPEQVAENLQKQGGFIPGVRPGTPTAGYFQYVLNRLLLVGGGFLALIAVLPMALQGTTGNAALVIGGTSVLIVVSVLVESMKQIEAQVAMREYTL